MVMDHSLMCSHSRLLKNQINLTVRLFKQLTKVCTLRLSGDIQMITQMLLPLILLKLDLQTAQHSLKVLNVMAVNSK